MMMMCLFCMGIYNKSWIVIMILLGHYFLFISSISKTPLPLLLSSLQLRWWWGMVFLFNFELTFFWVGLKECLFAWACEFSLFSSIFVPSTCLGTMDCCSLCVCVCVCIWMEWKELSSWSFGSLLLISD